jgi:hypothetical protein
MGSSKSDSKLIAFFGRLSYNYKMRYLLTGSLRYEGSSRFGANNKWGLFPAISGGWRISEEAFMNDITWVDDLKLRADFGVTGNQNIPNYKSLALFGIYGYQFYNGNYVATAGPSTNINPNLRWEKGYNWNIGVDFTLLKSILSGSINYYNRIQKDLVGNYDAPVPPNLVPTIYANVGTMKNSGFELEIQIATIRKKDFTYTIDVVGETMENKFVSFSNDVYTGRNYQDIAVLDLGGFGLSNVPVQRLEEGKRVGSFYTYGYAGLDESGNWLFWNTDNSKKLTSTEVTDADRRYTGNGLPKYRASMTNNFTYKDFDLTVSFRGAFDFDIYNVHEYAYGLKNSQRGYNTFLRAYTTNAAINAQIGKPTDFVLQKGDYLKLDAATLGYTLNFKDLRYWSSIRLYATGRNLLTFKSHNGLDPDYYPANGLTPGVPLNTNFYPSTRQFLIGTQINF